MKSSLPTFVSLGALALALGACGTEVAVGGFEDGTGGAGGGAETTGTGRGGDDTQVGPTTTGTGTSGQGGSGTSSGSETSSGSGSTTTSGVTVGSGGGGGGVACGGMAGDTCAPEEFCDFEQPGCDFADHQGTCQPRPQACPFDVVIPVCACDGEVYQSECFAQLAGSDVSGDGACGSLTPCGGKSGQTCGAAEYCDFEGDSCGSNDEQGVCRARPTDCPSGGEQPLPCACDGQAYWDACEAAKNGADVWGGVDLCEPVMCGGIGGIQCPEDQFCDYPDDSFCGGDDSLGVCRPRPTECPDDPPPEDAVCGCDLLTYASECEANRVGMDVTDGDPLECGGA